MDLTPFADFRLLMVGIAILLAVALTVLLPNLMPNSRGRLNRQRRELRHRHYQTRQAQEVLERASRKLARLSARANDVKPVQLQLAKDRVEDLTTMLGHARDKVLVAENHVRRILLDEYPPAKQQQMLDRFVSVSDNRALPFRF